MSKKGKSYLDVRKGEVARLHAEENRRGIVPRLLEAQTKQTKGKK